MGCDKFWPQMTLLAASYPGAMCAVLAYTVNDLLFAQRPSPTPEQAAQLRQTRQQLNDRAVRYLSEDMAVMTSNGGASFFAEQPRRARAMVAAMLLLARTGDCDDQDDVLELHMRAINAMIASWSSVVGQDALRDPFIDNVLKHLGKKWGEVKWEGGDEVRWEGSEE
jgi:hypothetical protein